MLPAALVTLVTFVLDLANSSPVYNMQPAFITTNIGSTNGRNIRNLPCVSRRNFGLNGVCMFAIDCLKANGTHLGTCIDRFYFGSCCHIEPIKEIENSIETNIILDTREPPERIQNTTLTSSTSTLSSLSVSSSTMQNINKLSQQSKNQSSTTEHYPSQTTTTEKIGPNTSSLSITTSTRPFGDKIITSSSTISSAESATTTSEKLQTFQIMDGSPLQTTTIRPLQSATTRRPNFPVRTTTSPTYTTKTPRPSIITTPKPPQRPSKPNATSSKPSSKPSKPVSSSKPTQKPSKPVKISSTTKRPHTTATSKVTSTKRTTTTKPTRRVTSPSSPKTTAKPATTTLALVTTTKATTKRPPVVLTKKPPSTTSPSPAATPRPTVKTSTKPTILEEPIIESSDTTGAPLTPSTPLVASTAGVTTITEEAVLKKNITQALESGTAHPSTNEIIGSSGLLTVESDDSGSTTSVKPVSSSTILGSGTVPTPTTGHVITSSPKPTISTLTQSTSPSSDISSTISTSKPGSGLITWTVEDQKNHTATSPINETVVTGNITEEWVPITTPDGWVLLPSVTPATVSKNDSMSSTSASSLPSSVEPFTTSIPFIDPSPQSALPTEAADTTMSSDLTSVLVQNTTSSLITSTTVIPSGDGKETTTTPTEIGTQVNLMSSVSSAGTVPVETTSTSTESSENRPVNMSDFTDVCGRRMWPEARIVGGEKSTFGRWPWQISLRQWRTSTYLHKCGAALLNENWAITAAHCVDNVPPSDLLLRLGEHDLSTEGEPYLHEERRVQIVASHPQFDPRTFEYDLALLRFYEPVQFQPNIIPVCVPKSDENFVGRTAYVTGWGRLYEDGPLPSVLQEVSVPVINNSVCESMYKSAGYIEHIPHIFICAGWRKGGFDSCEGDSGGPMVIQREDKRFLLAGVISWGIGCAEPNQPGVYTRISEFRDWINQILQF